MSQKVDAYLFGQILGTHTTVLESLGMRVRMAINLKEEDIAVCKAAAIDPFLEKILLRLQKSVRSLIFLM